MSFIFYYYFFIASDDLPETDLSVVIDALPVVILFRFFFCSAMGSVGFWQISSGNFGTSEDTKGAGGFTIEGGNYTVSCFVREDLPPLRVVVVERSTKLSLDVKKGNLLPELLRTWFEAEVAEGFKLAFLVDDFLSFLSSIKRSTSRFKCFWMASLFFAFLWGLWLLFFCIPGRVAESISEENLSSFSPELLPL